MSSPGPTKTRPEMHRILAETLGPVGGLSTELTTVVTYLPSDPKATITAFPAFTSAISTSGSAHQSGGSSIRCASAAGSKTDSDAVEVAKVKLSIMPSPDHNVLRADRSQSRARSVLAE